MNAFLQQQAALIAAAAQTGPDMTEAVKGGGGARLLPVGNAFAQLVEYVEYGSQPQEFNGVPKDPARCFSLGFALSGAAPDPANPGQFLSFANDDGTPYIMRTFPMAMSRNEKAKAFLLFKAMNWKNVHSHFAQMLGEKFIIKVARHTAKAAGSKEKSVLDLKSILPPLDVMSGQPYSIADAADSMYRLFLWDHPTIEGWNSLFIAGEYEAKDGKPAESKNYVQEEILGAVDFPGSPLEQLLLTSNVAFKRPAPKPVAAAPAAPAAAAPAVPAVAPAAPVIAAAPAPVAATPAATAPATPQPTAPAPSPVVPAVSAPTPAPVVGNIAPAMPVMPTMPQAA
jgi:hypothetical protein